MDDIVNEEKKRGWKFSELIFEHVEWNESMVLMNIRKIFSDFCTFFITLLTNKINDIVSFCLYINYHAERNI